MTLGYCQIHDSRVMFWVSKEGPPTPEATVATTRSKTELKHLAQDVLMAGIANQLSYYEPAKFGVTLTQRTRQSSADR